MSNWTQPPLERDELGLCPICQRLMLAGGPLDRHHFLPKSQGGREALLVHRICHRQLHALFTNAELAKELSAPEAVCAHPKLQRFLTWIAGKHPDFYERTSRPRASRKKYG